MLELLNKVWDLGLVLLLGCSGGAYKSGGSFGFGVLTVLVVCRGLYVSFNTTVGGVVLLKDISAKGNSRSFILFRRKHWLLTIRKL